MNANLLRSCACLWLLGLFGMWIARALFALELDALPFQLAARFFFVGGVGYTGIGVLGLASNDRARRVTRRDSADMDGVGADLSAWIRRR